MSDQAETKPIASLVGERSKSVPLRWPVQFDGKTYDHVTVRRMTGNEVAAFFKAEGDAVELPMFDCPREVIDALDADDAEDVNRVVLDFLPRSMRPGSDG